MCESVHSSGGTVSSSALAAACGAAACGGVTAAAGREGNEGEEGGAIRTPPTYQGAECSAADVGAVGSGGADCASFRLSRFQLLQADYY